MTIRIYRESGRKQTVHIIINGHTYYRTPAAAQRKIKTLALIPNTGGQLYTTRPQGRKWGICS